MDNIAHIESQSLYGIAVVKVFFQPSVSIDKAVAQITANSQTQLWRLLVGTTPPLIITYSASTVPILQLGLSGKGISEQQLNDYGLNFIRPRLVTIEVFWRISAWHFRATSISWSQRPSMIVPAAVNR